MKIKKRWKRAERNITEAKSQIPRYTQSINEVQEQAVQATRDIAESYLEYQKQAIDSFQSIFTPYIENANNQMLNNQTLFRRLPEIYSKIALLNIWLLFWIVWSRLSLRVVSFLSCLDITHI